LPPLAEDDPVALVRGLEKYLQRWLARHR
jgi:hypothetical protein